jgi:hypothetical protein
MTRDMPWVSWLWLVAGSLAGCATSPGQDTAASARPAVRHVTLAATPSNAGEVGHAYLVPQDGHTAVVLKASGTPGWMARPVHLYAYVHEGSCASPSPRPAFALADRVLARRELDGWLTVRNTLPVSLEALERTAHSLVVRSSPADANIPLFCGDLRAG